MKTSNIILIVISIVVILLNIKTCNNDKNFVITNIDSLKETIEQYESEVVVLENKIKTLDDSLINIEKSHSEEIKFLLSKSKKEKIIELNKEYNLSDSDEVARLYTDLHSYQINLKSCELKNDVFEIRDKYKDSVIFTLKKEIIVFKSIDSIRVEDLKACDATLKKEKRKNKWSKIGNVVLGVAVIVTTSIAILKNN